MRAWHRPTPHASRRGDGRLRGAAPGALKLRPSRKIPKWSSSWLRLSRSKLFLIPHLSYTVLLGNRYLPLPTPARLLWGPRSMRLLLPVPWSSTLRQRPSPVSGQRLWCVMMVRLVWPDLFFAMRAGSRAMAWLEWLTAQSLVEDDIESIWRL